MVYLPDRVTELRGTIVDYPMPEPIAAGRWMLETLSNIVVQVRSASGLAGTGYAFVFRNADAQTILSAICSLRELVIGHDPMDTVGLHAQLRAGANFVGAAGAAMSALGAIDLAMWDLKGKLLDKPVHVLLGLPRTGACALLYG